MEEAVMEESPTQASSSTTKIITTTETVNVVEVVEPINVLSEVEEANIQFSLPEMTSRDEKLSFSTAANLGIPVNGATSLQREIEKIKISSDSNPPVLKDSTSFQNVRTEVQNVGIIIENQPGVQELYLDRVYQKQETQEFYCPHCKVCIQKVLIQGRDWETTTPLRPQPFNTFRCTSCFSFLIPIGRWLCPCLVPADEEDPPKEPVVQVTEPKIKPPAPVTDEEDAPKEPDHKIAQDPSGDKAPLADEGDKASTSGADPDALKQEYPAPGWPVIPPVPTKPKEPKIDPTPRLDLTPGPAGEVRPDVSVPIPVEPVVKELKSSKKWEILKSIVYGGLTESIASLSVVTSAASADASTLSIVALALANLIGGLFILVHNLWELKSEEFTKVHDEARVEVDRYYMTLGRRENFALHATIVILSFLVFGLVPPVVYGFTFYESNSKDLKLAAVAVASLVCITLLAIAKACIQKPTKHVTYFTTVMYYVGSGALASIVAYLAGDLIKKLINKLGWFSSSSSLTLPLLEINVAKSGWRSY